MSGPTYEIGNQLFVMVRAFLDSAGVDSSACKVTIEMPDSAGRDALVDHLRNSAPTIGEFTRGSGAQAGNFGGAWQGVAYEWTVK